MSRRQAVPAESGPGCQGAARAIGGGALVFGWMCDAVGDRDGVTVVDGPVSVWFAEHRSVTEGQLGLLLAKVTSPAALVALVLVAAVLLRWRG